MQKPKADLKDLKHVQAVDGAAPVSCAVETHGIVRESPVDVMMMLAPERYAGEPISDRRVVRIKVWSNIKPELFSFTDIRVPGNTKQEMHRKCVFAAASLAERQIIMGTGSNEPSYTARKAGDHFIELCEHLSKQR